MQCRPATMLCRAVSKAEGLTVFHQQCCISKPSTALTLINTFVIYPPGIEKGVGCNRESKLRSSAASALWMRLENGGPAHGEKRKEKKKK